MRQEIRKLRMRALLAMFILFLSLMFVTTPVAAQPYIPPEAFFTYEPTNPVAYQMITFDGSSSTADPSLFIDNYTWDFGDGSRELYSEIARHPYLSAGDYVVALTVRDNIGGLSSTSETIIVGEAWYPWPMFHHDAQRTGIATANGISTVPANLRWTFTTGDQIVSSPAVSKAGIIYFGSEDNNLYALDASGNPAPGSWPFSTSPASISSSPAIAEEGPEEGTIYIGTHDNVAGRYNFFAINPDGTLKWGICLSDYVPGDWIGPSSPAITYEGVMPVIYIASMGGYLYRIEDHGPLPADGFVSWFIPLYLDGPLGPILCPITQSPATSPDDQTIYIGTGLPLPIFQAKGKLFAVDRSGTIRWSRDDLVTWQDESVSSPSVEIVDGIPTIYAGTSDHRMYAVQDLGGPNNRIKWYFTDTAALLLGGVASCPAIYDLNGDGDVEIIFGSGNRYVYAVTDDGPHAPGTDPPLYWKYQTGDEVGSSAAVALALASQPTVLIGSNDNRIYSINWDKSTWGTWGVGYTDIGGDVVSSPAVAQARTAPSGAPGWVFVGSDDGNLYAFGPQRPGWDPRTEEYQNSITQPIDVSKIRFVHNAVNEKWVKGSKWPIPMELMYWQKSTKYLIEIDIDGNGNVTRVGFRRWGNPITEIPYDLAEQSLASLPPGFAIICP